ncbi:MAG: hypothetical protein HOY78_27855 [Saccharothrix sp.]|nr:hypothetical protein [Saccharothrix sp.]
MALLVLVAGCAAEPAESPRGPLVLSLSADSPSPQRVEAVKGQQVEITVTSKASVEVHVHGFDVTGVAAEGKPAVVKFVADRVGTFDVEAHPDTLLAQLVVR